MIPAAAIIPILLTGGVGIPANTILDELDAPILTELDEPILDES
jgi:hypothetical protein